MPITVECRTQPEAEAALSAGNIAHLIEGHFSLATKGEERPQIILSAKAVPLEIDPEAERQALWARVEREARDRAEKAMAHG